MIDFEGSIVIACALEEVFAFVSNPENIPSYQDKVVSVVMQPPGEVRQGARFAETVQMGPGKMLVACEIVALDRPRHVAFTARGKAVHCDAEYSFTTVPGGTRLAVAGRAALQGWRRIMEPLMRGEIRRAVPRELHAIQERLTGTARRETPALAALTRDGARVG